MGTVLQLLPAERKAFGNTPLQQPTETRQERVNVEVDETEAHCKRRDKQSLLIPFHYAIEDPEEQLKPHKNNLFYLLWGSLAEISLQEKNLPCMFADRAHLH